MKKCKYYFDWNNPSTGIFSSIEEVILSKKTKYQNIDVVNFSSYGLGLIIDGKIQTSEYDDFLYHETIVHIPFLTHSAPRKIFIIGGGDGGVLREAIKYKKVTEITMVDIDNEAVEICKKYLEKIHRGAFYDPRLKLVFDDGRKFVEETNDKFDIAIIDSTDPLEGGTSHLLFTKQFFKALRDKLYNDGMVVVQSNCLLPRREEMTFFLSLRKTLESIFEKVSFASIYLPSFALQWIFQIASRKYTPEDLTEEEIERRIKERINGELKLIDGKTFKSLTVMPKFLREMIKTHNEIISDDKPIFVF